MANVARGTQQTDIQTSVSDTDYASWPTKEQAAARIGVTTKTIERLTQDGQIQCARWQPQGRGPVRVVYHPDDVARVAATRAAGPLPPFVVPVPAAVTGNGTGRHAPAPATTEIAPPRRIGSMEEFLQGLATAFVRVSETSQTPEEKPLYLTVGQAATRLNWTTRNVRDAVRRGELPCRFKDQRDWHTWRIKRTDVEAL